MYILKFSYITKIEKQDSCEKYTICNVLRNSEIHCKIYVNEISHRFSLSQNTYLSLADLMSLCYFACVLLLR